MSLHWLPNAITFARIALIIPVLSLIHMGEYGWALLLFAMAGFSDGLDGFLAVRFGWQSRLGALLDPIADKLLVAGMFITLTATGDLPLWLTTMVILRDVVIIGGATAYHYLVEPVQGEPSRVSKLNTALQLLLLLSVLSQAAFDWPPAVTVTVLGAATMVTVVISGADYVLRWSARARRGVQA
ncbi:MAG: CDP-alcohol phosphatidyltransferase family protein [Pseudomonadota bacterium]